MNLVPGTKFTKHRKTSLQQCYEIWQVHDRFAIKHDLQEIVRESYEKHTTKLTKSTTAHSYDSIKLACSNYLEFSLVYNSHKVP